MITVEELTTDAAASSPFAPGQHNHPLLKKPPRFERKLRSGLTI